MKKKFIYPSLLSLSIITMNILSVHANTFYSPNTGDDQQMLLPLVILIISFIMIIGAIFFKKKSDNKKKDTE